MARSKYGSSYSSSSRCFSDYWDRSPYAISNYARGVVFLAVYLGIFITLFVARRRVGAGKRLIGWAYTGALFFTVIQYIFQFVLSTLNACDALNDRTSVYDTNIASMVFSWLQTMLLLYVVFYLLNIMLRKQLGQNLSVLKVVFGIDLLILGVLLLTTTAMLCQYYYWYGHGSYWRSGPTSVYASVYINLAFNAFQVLSIIGSGVLSILAVKSLKQRSMAQTSLLLWVTVLHFGLLFSAVWTLTLNAMSLGGPLYNTQTSYEVLSWFSEIFYAVAVASIIVIARNSVWRSAAYAEQQQYACQQEAPVYDGAQRA
ncbi:hypothetical protein E8E12_010361 [Didymella heteroderae]|uniref:Uncharacterized protein n=1 Tax=Didymella heteroderae TaxID=1769908 RepID=A0A9P4WY99_9PLEO|nr:hypothetical protein E8E12_010361 [Didymella heteroderae]